MSMNFSDPSFLGGWLAGFVSFQQDKCPCAKSSAYSQAYGKYDMVLVLRRVVLLHALFSAWCAAQQRTGDGRVILNLGYITSHGGNYVSNGEGTCRHEWLVGAGAATVAPAAERGL